MAGKVDVKQGFHNQHWPYNAMFSLKQQTDTSFLWFMCREQKEQLQKLKEFKPDISTQDSPRSQNTGTRPGAFQVNIEVKISRQCNVLMVIAIRVYFRSFPCSDDQTFLWNYLPSSPYNFICLLLRQSNFVFSLDFPEPVLVIQFTVSSKHGPQETVAHEI